MKWDKDKPNNKSVWVWWLLILTLGLSLYTFLKQDDSQKGIMAEPQVRQKLNFSLPVRAPTNVSDSAVHDTDFKIQPRTALFNHQKNLFKVYYGQENSIKNNSVVKLSPPKLIAPVAPRIPFVYMGKLDNTPKGTIVYLQGNDKVYAVAKGEKVDAFWRFDDEFIVSLQLTYLPLNIPQVLLKSQQVSPDAVVALPVNEAN